MQRSLMACQLVCAPVLKGEQQQLQQLQQLQQQQVHHQQKFEHLRSQWQEMQDFNAKNQVMPAASTQGDDNNSNFIVPPQNGWTI